MSRPMRISAFVLIGVAAALLLMVAVFVILTRTEFGLERVSQLVIGQFEDQIEGELRVERITTDGLLGGAVVHDFAIDDRQGRPFVSADSIRLAYDWRSLFGERIIIDHATVYGAEVHITKLPGDTAWNYEYIFPDRTPYVDTPDPFILIESARVRSGLAVVRYPWEPDEDEPTEPSDTARLILEAASGGILRVLRFEDADAVLSRVLWSSPVEDGKLFGIEELSTRGYIYERPFQLRDLRGTVTVRDSVVAYDAAVVRLPSSAASSIGEVVIGEELVRYDLRIEAEELAFRDLQWLYPRLPDEGGGNALLRVNTLGPERTLWLATDAYLQAPGTEVAGTLGLVTGDTLYFTRVDLRASPLNLALIEQITPGDLPLEGLLVGTVEVTGPLSALDVSGDMRLRAPGGGIADVRWTGVIDTRSGVPRRLDASIRRLDAVLANRIWPGLGGAGTFSGRVRLTAGAADGSLDFTGRILHSPADSAATSTSEFALDGLLRLAVGDSAPPTINATVRAEPLALGTVANWWEEARGLDGPVRGDVRIHGPLDAVDVRADLELPGGPLALAGHLDVSGPRPAYRLDADFRAFHLDSLVPMSAAGVASGRLVIRGTGVSPDSMRGSATLTIDSARLGGLNIRHGVASVAVRNGTLRVDTLRFASPSGALTARGTFGLTAGTPGELDVGLRLRSLAEVGPFIAPWLASSVEADSFAIQDVNGRLFGAGPTTDLAITAVLEGGITSFDAQARLRAPRAVFRSTWASNLAAHFAGRDIGGNRPEYEGWLEADTLDLGTRRLVGLRVDAEYTGTRGGFAMRANGPDSVRYQLAGIIRRDGASTQLQLRDLRAGPERNFWTLEGPATFTFSDHGMAVEELVLARPNGGRITADGRLPWIAGPETLARPAARPVGFNIGLDSVRIAPLLRIGQFQTEIRGILDAQVSARGTAGAPRYAGEVSVTGFRRDDLRLRRAEFEFTYDDKRVDARVELWNENRRILLGRGEVPVDLALVPVDRRRLPAQLEVSLDANRIPAALAATMLDGFENVRGEIDGAIAIGGTTRDPALAGGLVLHDGSGTWTPLGVRYHDLQATLRVLNDRMVAVDISGAAGEEGEANIGGRITFETLADPLFDLTMRMDRFPGVTRPEIGFLATGEIRLGGSYTRPVVTGDVRVDRGALHLDELARARRIVEIGEPILLGMLDSALVAGRDVAPDERGPFLRNLALDATVAVGRGFWLRGANMDVEMTGDITVAFDRRQDEPQLSGTLSAIRGSYILHVYDIYQRRFAVREGTVEFVGAPGLNPNLNMTAGYRVRTGQGYPIDILVHVAGTLRDPRVRLTSDAEPPIGESDLLSYLIFGRPTYALAPDESRLVNRFVGLGVQTLFAPTLEPIAGEIENALGLDYFAITSTGIGPAAVRTGAAANDPPWAMGAQIEGGWYLTPELFGSLTARAPLGAERSGLQSLGMRLDWQFLPTWSAEFFWGDQLARYPSFGGDAILRQRKLIGLFLAREWGY